MWHLGLDLETVRTLGENQVHSHLAYLCTSLQLFCKRIQKSVYKSAKALECACLARSDFEERTFCTMNDFLWGRCWGSGHLHRASLRWAELSSTFLTSINPGSYLLNANGVP